MTFLDQMIENNDVQMIINLISFIFGGIGFQEFQFQDFDLYNQKLTASSLLNQIVQFFINGFQNQIIGVIGRLDILGKPDLLLQSLSNSFFDLIFGLKEDITQINNYGQEFTKKSILRIIGFTESVSSALLQSIQIIAQNMEKNIQNYVQKEQYLEHVNQNKIKKVNQTI
ncbi:hypothetical protein PPERSA_11756 [Pseudocohnilembus persalinus]|uniref:Uncharacterized protein n=1 Tax=Pseudocohnilembus persalinus TaxID=266149 RepID=A0A0V0QGG4_PSEPJ|nr:hypothetical protein PPERSA_11756 [Pseudocohnilembus persalinus]|eukprot:KRX01309.1 hypothetical protein PPERSA_11756 [Pseudocohnilembus persalinus]